MEEEQKGRTNVGRTNSKKVRALQDPTSRMQQLGGLALDEIEQRILNHEATAQELTTLARLGSEKTILENEKLKREVELLKAKKENLEATQRMDELFADAIKMMGIYRGEVEEDEDVF